MTLPGYLAFYAVGAVLVLIGLVLLLATPAPGLLVLLVGAVHLGIGAVLRGRAQRGASQGGRP